jgi:hypothetical protein
MSDPANGPVIVRSAMVARKSMGMAWIDLAGNFQAEKQ